jgi:hypothetical protein
VTALFLIALTGVASGIGYCLRRQWLDALLVLLAAAGLAGLVGQFSTPGSGSAAAIEVDGDGLRAAQWQDLPARALNWKAPSDDVLRLDFPRIATPGRMFRLTATMPRPAQRRLQLLAENGQVVAEADGAGAALTVQWLPPVAETLLFKARLLDAGGKLVAQGPVPFQVREVAPLQVQGRFASPSFDAGALNVLLANSGAVLDWQVTLGKTVTRSETARAGAARPDLLVADAAYIETMSEHARAALLAQVAAGAPLLVLAFDAREPQFWARSLQLVLKEQGEAKATGAPLALMSAPFNPLARGPWSLNGDRLWSRQWQKGRIAWLGVSDWHRYAISEPQALGAWWQDVLDRAGVRREETVAWLEPEEMALPGERLEVCAHGVSGEVTFPDLKQTLAWQRRPEKADAACVAVWPAASGWLKMQTGKQSGQLYVYAKDDWPLWQKAQRRDATARYAARTPQVEKVAGKALPAWPFALLFALAILCLWWRERR